MIEKFSEEELKQIKKELGISMSGTKAKTCEKEIDELDKLWANKPTAGIHSNFFKIIDVTLCNYRYDKYNTPANKNVKEEDKEEYSQMFREILEIIKKHNRKLEGDVD